MFSANVPNKLTVEWVNHASYIVRFGDVNLITDPWLFGSAFQNGWDLLSPTEFKLDDFASITHIWFSHEHPDHFMPPVIRAIPEEHRRRIVVLFQETKDRRLVRFCEKLGFTIRELPLLDTVKIGDDLEVVCNRQGTEDSWLYMRAGNHRLLNLNDCVFLNEREIERIRHRVGEVDLLFSISGYAEKIGELGQNEKRRAASQKYVDLLVQEAEIFKPKYVVPFASYKFFSHEENFYNNDGALSPREVFDDVRSRVTCETLIFYPGDSWSYGDTHNSTSAVERYSKDWVARKPKHGAGEVVPMERLVELSNRYNKRLNELHSRLIMRLLHWAPPNLGLRSLRIYLTDLKQVVLFSVLHPCQVLNADRENSDLEMSSECLAFVYEFDYGANTLMVNARYSADPVSNRLMFNVAHLGLMRNADQALSLGYIFKNFFRVLATSSQ